MTRVSEDTPVLIAYKERSFSENYIWDNTGSLNFDKAIEGRKYQNKRMISSAKLNTLLCLYPHPINVVVFDDPSGKTHLGSSLALRCFQRLSIPYVAAQRCH